MKSARISAFLMAWGLGLETAPLGADETEAPFSRAIEPTWKFEGRNGRAFLGGGPVRLWGTRCGRAVTERCVRALDNQATHGINLIGGSLQVVNVETRRIDISSHDSISNNKQMAVLRSDFDRSKEAPNAVMLLHSGFRMGITNESATARPSPGGTGTA